MSVIASNIGAAPISHVSVRVKRPLEIPAIHVYPECDVVALSLDDLSVHLHSAEAARSLADVFTEAARVYEAMAARPGVKVA